MSNLGVILGTLKGLVVILALLASYNAGVKSVKLDAANSKIEKVKENEEVYRDVYSKSDADVLDSLRKYERR